MGVRTVRYCDITGIASDDVTHHELQIDQMRVEIDLVEAEYQRLLQALQPFIDAGRVEASIPTPTAAGTPTAGDGQPRDLLADLTAIMAGRKRVELKEAVASLQQLDPATYGTSAPRVLAKALPAAAKPYRSDGGRWIPMKRILAARGTPTTRHPKKTREQRSGKPQPGPRTGLF